MSGSKRIILPIVPREAMRFLRVCGKGLRTAPLETDTIGRGVAGYRLWLLGVERASVNRGTL
jgi:hypothetical protein